MESEVKQSVGLGVIMFLIFAVISFVWSVVYTIPAGYVGVYHLFGKVDDVEKLAGIHIKNPLAKVTKMSIKTQEYTMSGVPSEGEKKGMNDAITSLTKEGLAVDLDVTVLYRLNPLNASDIYKNVGTNYVDILVRPKIRESIRSVTAKYDAKTIYSEKRSALQHEIEEAIARDLNSRGIIIERVLLRNVKLPEKVTKAIEDKLEAEQNAQAMVFILQKEKQEAERKRIEAEGIADANKIIAGSLSEQYLRWYWIENLDKHQDTIYVPVGKDGMPMFKTIS